MFLYSLLVTLYTFLCFVLVLIIMVQKSKGSTGLGNLGGATQMLFGGSGGQDLFQKLTWVFGAIFMAASLGIALMRAYETKMFQYIRPTTQQVVPQESAQEPMTLPLTTPDATE